ncbi:Ankyrin repeat domain-containing protein [Mycena venus]|uniref:Ankyrin repeat domain-containing protein n=1 Tax=Mycena venus TaxID=2733690 RepID=A0A8H6XN90_9AGAR|nr:Ankyrin repeat domain-containing protein [Mycena venus]
MADILGVLASVLQLVDMVAAAGIYLKDLRNAPAEQVKIFNEIEVLKPLLGELHTRISVDGATGRTTLKSLHEPLAQFERILKQLADKVDPARADRLSRRVNWTLWDKKQVKVDLDEIERFKTTLNYWLGLNTWDISQHRERERIIQWFSPLNFFPQQDDILSTRHEGTGEWLLNANEFREWKSKTGSTLWCYGMPGAGKTVLASLVADHLGKEAQVQWQEFKTRSCGVACIYCNHKETAVQTPLNILASLWRQLIHGQTISGYVWDLYRKHDERHTRPTMEEVLAALRSTIACYTKVFFIIDGLDEYTADEGNARTILFARLRSLGPTVNLILTSRPHIDVPAAFPCSLRLEIRANLNHTYDVVLERIYCQNQDDSRLATQVLLWISSSKRPLLVSELQEALAIETGTTALDADSLPDIDIILSICGGLVVVDWSNCVFRLVHYTTQHYLERVRAQRFPDAQTVITAACLTYLSFDVFANPSQHHRYQTYKGYMFLPYAAEYCLIHAKGEPESSLKDEIVQFLSDAPRWKLFSPREYWPSSASKLWVAASFNLCEIVAHLLAQPRAFEDQNKAAGNPLYVAASSGFLEMVSLLLGNGTDVDEQGGIFGTPLQAASVEGHEAIVRLLIDHGADVNRKEGIFGTALQAASVHGHERTVRLLVESGANVNIKGGEFDTALVAASLHGRKTIVQLLLDHGATVDLLGWPWGTALHAASGQGREAIVNLLIQHGANVNATCNRTGTALQAAASRGHMEVVRLLIETGAYINAPAGDNGTALQAASAMGHEAVVRFLLENGADVNAYGGEFCTALWPAVTKGHVGTVRLLIKAGVNLNTKGGRSYRGICDSPSTPLQTASAMGNEEMVRILVESGADVNVREGKYGTALRGASSRGHKNVVQFLLDHGADDGEEVNGHHSRTLE